MTDVKDTVASHISTNWDGGVVGGSGSKPTVDAVGPEDIEKPEDYPEAVLVYNERVSWDRVFTQGAYGDRHTRVYILVTAHTKSGCTKTHFRAFIDELKSVLGSAITGFDLQVLDPEENVTRTKGHAGGMYQASFVLHLWEYGVSTSSAASGGAAGTSIWAEPFVTTAGSANLTNETVISAALGAHPHDIIPATDSTYDLGSTTKRYATAFIDTLTLTNPLADANVANDVTLDNITQITTRKLDDMQAPDATVDCGGQVMDNVATIRNGSTINLQANDDTDDYIQFDTVSNIYPMMKSIGDSGLLLLESDSATIVQLAIWDGAKGIYPGWNKTTQQGRIYSQEEILITANADIDDCLYFSTATNIAYLLPVEDKIHCLGSASLSYDHVYADDFDNTSPFEVIDQPLEALKAISHKKVEEQDKLDYTTFPDFVRTHIRDPKQDVIEEYEDEITGTTQQRVIERAPKDVIAEEGFSINRMCILLYQAVQELTAKVEALEAAQTPKGG